MLKCHHLADTTGWAQRGAVLTKYTHASKMLTKRCPKKGFSDMSNIGRRKCRTSQPVEYSWISRVVRVHIVSTHNEELCCVGLRHSPSSNGEENHHRLSTCRHLVEKRKTVFINDTSVRA